MYELTDLLISTLLLAIAAAITLWMAGAIYYDVCRQAMWGKVLVVSWVGGVFCCSLPGNRSGSRLLF